MKTNLRLPAIISPKTKHGFALVVTLSLMILLTVVAVGLLTLSTISLRASSQNEAMATARANARMALMLALGDLQKSLGPDRAVTATSQILAAPPEETVAKPNTTGVWESWWDFNPNSSPAPNYIAEKTNRFRRWLVSNADFTAPTTKDFVTQAWTGKTIELVGNGSLGANAPAASKAVAGLVPVFRNGQVQGAYAWHVSDESVKARINLYRDPTKNTTLAQKRALLAGHRPDSSVIKGGSLDFLPTDTADKQKSAAEKYADALSKENKLIDFQQFDLLDNALSANNSKIKPFRNDVTPYSLGVLADVRGGGLKQDLSSMFEISTTNTLPAEFNGRKLYESTHGITGVSDPNWSTLASYYNSFRSLTPPAEESPTFAVKSETVGTTPQVPTTYNPAPVIAKVDTVYSIVGRPCTDVFWLDNAGQNNGARSKYDYFVNLVVTPVVTLHNPYNVSISFHKMNVTFENIPVAFRFMFQSGGSGPFLSQSVKSENFESYNEMIPPGRGGNIVKYGIDIANWSNPLASDTNISGSIIMKPGQTLICGPYIDPQASFKKDAGLGNKVVAFDWLNNLTKAMKARPVYIPGLGFETCSVTMAHSVKDHPNWGGSWCTFQFLRDQNANPKVSQTTVTDRLYLEFKIQQPRAWDSPWNSNVLSANKSSPVNPSFAVTAQIQATAGDNLVECAKLRFDYNNDSTLKNLFNDRVYRYPPTDSLTGSELAARSGELYSSQTSYVHPFAIFSAYSRTTNGGVYETGKRTKSGIDSPEVNLLRDGRLAGKPFLFHNPSRSNFTMNLATEKPGVQAYELNFQPFLSKGDFERYMEMDGNRVPSLTGNRSTSGIKSGSYLELPSGPLQTIADFRRSNALTTSYLPQFVQPVSNSLLHPLMSPNKVVESNASISTQALLDQSVLANHALYDRFYFSTFATQGSTTPDTVFEDFMKGKAPLSSQAFQPYQPVGTTVATAKAELYSSSKPKDGAYKMAAAYQMIRGAFNVNSTSVQAWKAKLASMNKSEVATLWAKTAALEIKTATGTPIKAMSLLNGGAIPGGTINVGNIDSENANKWNGYRELTDAELENLAVEIVDEVRTRGPFLSMSEFVNRQVGSSGPLTLSGALETAITSAEINEKKNASPGNAFLDQVPLTTSNFTDPETAKFYNYKTLEATIGNPAAGAPGWVNQGDLLRILEPAATVRGDTFVIRAYGEAQGSNGVTARAYAEAVVQRVPEYVDPADRPSVNASDAASTAAASNKTFGRRINVVSFRWLSSNEI